MEVMNMYPIVKRLLDIILGIAGMVVLMPVGVLIAILIKLDSRGPIFFKQKRIGRHKKEFHMIKFRTMIVDAPRDRPTHMLDNSQSMITRIGSLLRKTSLDEIPQMLNIIKGDMSIIGPRPALWNQYDLIEQRDQYGANDIYPGLTGLAQINGRDELSIGEKAQLDGEYTKKLGLAMDINIFIRSISTVLRSEGVRDGSEHYDNRH
jgi:O-antigen biosynthesis protein WbqP